MGCCSGGLSVVRVRDPLLGAVARSDRRATSQAPGSGSERISSSAAVGPPAKINMAAPSPTHAGVYRDVAMNGLIDQFHGPKNTVAILVRIDGAYLQFTVEL